jgi:hypothetical protein
MGTNLAKNNPMIMGSIQKNIFEHISLMAQEQVQLEYRNEMAELQALQQDPMNAQNPEVQQQAQRMMQTIEGRKAVLIADMTEEFMKEEQQVTSVLGNDPLALLKARELDLRSQENSRKEKEGIERLNLDKMKAMMNQSNQQQKLNQNEELANLRADTSIEKTILSKTINPKGVF